MATKRTLRYFPDAVLRQISEPVNPRDPAVHVLVKDMIQVMREQKDGIGIAAPQLGVSRQVAVVDVSARVAGSQRLVLLNPEILELKQEKLSREGCMSVPDYTARIKRFERVRVRWQDLDGRWHEKECGGIEAVCLQHEIDHLQGRLFLDHVVSLKRDMIPRPKHFRL